MTYQIADSVFDSLVASNNLLPVQWARPLRRRYLFLLPQFLVSGRKPA
jgi:hypothetical protein